MKSEPDEVLLNIPAQPEYTRIVRVGAAALALRHGMSFGEIDELRTVVDQAVALLLDGASEPDLTVQTVFRTTDDHFEIEASRTGNTPLNEAAIERFTAAASELVDEFEITADRATVHIRKAPATRDVALP